jgi:hypothetical protein
MMEHSFMLSGILKYTPDKVRTNNWGDSVMYSVTLNIQPDVVENLSLPNGFSNNSFQLTGFYSLKKNEIPFYLKEGNKLLIHGNLNSKAKHSGEPFDSSSVNIKTVNLINTQGNINICQGIGIVDKSLVGKLGVLYLVKEKKKKVGNAQGDPGYRFYTVYSPNTSIVIPVEKQIVFAGRVVRGVFKDGIVDFEKKSLKASEDKYHPFMSPIFYADSIMGYVQ